MSRGLRGAPELGQGFLFPCRVDCRGLPLRKPSLPLNDVLNLSLVINGVPKLFQKCFT